MWHSCMRASSQRPLLHASRQSLVSYQQLVFSPLFLVPVNLRNSHTPISMLSPFFTLFPFSRSFVFPFLQNFFLSLLSSATADAHRETSKMSAAAPACRALLVNLQKLLVSLSAQSVRKACTVTRPARRQIRSASDATRGNTLTFWVLRREQTARNASQDRSLRPLALVWGNVRTARVDIMPTNRILSAAMRALPAGTTRTTRSLQIFMSSATTVRMVFQSARTARFTVPGARRENLKLTSPPVSQQRSVATVPSVGRAWTIHLDAISVVVACTKQKWGSRTACRGESYCYSFFLSL